MTNDIYSADNEVKSQWLKWGKPGDCVSGTLSAKRKVKNTMPGKEGEMQMVYEIKTKDGSFHEINEDKTIAEKPTVIKEGEYWIVGGKAGIDAQLRNIKIGQIMALKFIEQVPSKTKGYNPTKVIKAYTAGKMDESFVAEVGEEVDPLKNF